MTWSVHHGDCLEWLRSLPDNSVDAVVTDPPYGLGKPPPIRDVLTAWLDGDRYDRSRPKKGTHHCLGRMFGDAIIGDADNANTEAREKGITLSVGSAVAPVKGGRVEFDNQASAGEVEIGAERAFGGGPDLLMHERFAQRLQSFDGGQLRLRPLEGFTPCVGVCACARQTTPSRIAVRVRLGDDTSREASASSGVVALAGTKMVAVLTLDVRRNTLEVGAANTTDERLPLFEAVTTEPVRTGAGTRSLAAVAKPNDVGAVAGGAHGTLTINLFAHRNLRKRVDNPIVTPKGFMGRKWDAFVPGPVVWGEVHRVLKPGGHAVVFAGQRTADVMAIALRLGGFELRELGAWAFFSGFPKSADISCHIDRWHGAEREVVGRESRPYGYQRDGELWRKGTDITAPATDDAKRWAGWGTATKPAFEPYWLCRKPISESSIARNVLRWGTGAINVDGCRFAYGDRAWVGPCDGTNPGPVFAGAFGKNGVYGTGTRNVDCGGHTLGRFPANLYHCPKASTAEREAGCDGLPVWSAGDLVEREEGSAGIGNPRAGAGRTSNGRANHHNTVKPVGLMRWLCRLVTPPGGTVIDPYTGSGTTGIAAVVEGFDFRGAELNNNDGPPPQRFVDIANARISWWERHGEDSLEVWKASHAATVERESWEAVGQLGMFGGER